jgi:hypothetical protein
MEKEKKIIRIRQPIHLTLSKETIKVLKNTGNNASKVIDTLIKDAFSESKPLRVLIGDFQWARRDSNSRPYLFYRPLRKLKNHNRNILCIHNIMCGKHNIMCGKHNIMCGKHNGR